MNSSSSSNRSSNNNSSGGGGNRSSGRTQENSFENEDDFYADLNSLVTEAESLIGKDSVRAQQVLEKAFKLAKSQHINDPRALKIAAYLSHYNCQFEKAASESAMCLQLLNQAPQDDPYVIQIRLDALFLLGDSLLYLSKLQSALRIFKLLQTSKVSRTDIFQQDQTASKIAQIQTIQANSTLLNARTESKKIDCERELQQFKSVLESCEKNDYMNQHGMLVSLLPARWFKKWKDYVNWGNSTAKPSKKTLPKLNLGEWEVEEIAYEFLYPGEIDCADILEQYPRHSLEYGIDPDKTKSYCNVVLKKELEEQHHFILLPVPASDVLYSIYGGIKAKRLILPLQDDSKLSTVEIKPLQLRFITVLNQQNNSKSGNDIDRSLSQGKVSQIGTINSDANEYIKSSGNLKKGYKQRKLNSDQNENLTDKMGKKSNQVQQDQLKSGVSSSHNTLNSAATTAATSLKSSQSGSVFSSQQLTEMPVRYDRAVMKIQICKKETLNNLKEKLIRVFAFKNNIDLHSLKQFEARIWRCDDTVNIKELMKQIDKREGSNVLLSGRLLSDGCVPLEDAELAADDLLILECGELQVLQSQSDKNSVQIPYVCGYCGGNVDLHYCQCMLIRYCNVECQRKHRQKHANLCQQTLAQIQDQKEVLDSLNIKSNRKVSLNGCKGICGLKNLGNTCFMNSSLQCLSNIQELTAYMLQNTFLKDINRSNPLGTGGYLAAAYAELIKDLWTGSSKYASPWNLKKIIGKFAPQFSGYSQQDSHELLSYMLDGIHEDLNRVRIKPLVTQVESDGSNDLDAAVRSWQNYQKRNRSVVSELLVGQFKSTLICPSCRQVSVTFDPYMTISLPIPTPNNLTLTVYILPRDPAVGLQLSKLSFQKTDTVLQLKETVMKQINLLTDKDNNETKDNNNSSNIDNYAVCLQSFADNYESQTIGDQIKLDQLAAHTKDAYIFAYQKTAKKNAMKRRDLIVDIDSDIPTDKNKLITVKLQIKLWEKKEGEFTFSTYARIFLVGGGTTYETIHLKAWQIYRSCLVEAENVNQPTSLEQLKAEYERFMAQQSSDNQQKQDSKPNSKPKEYELILEDRFDLEYSAEKTLASEFEEISKLTHSVDLRLAIHSMASEEDLKLNSYSDNTKNKSNNQPKTQHKLTLEDSFESFTQREVLEKGNEWYCAKCKTHVQASKQLEIFSTPKILILHIKRFRLTRHSHHSALHSMFSSSGGYKLDDYVHYPLKGLDLSKYVLFHKLENQNKSPEPLLYDLFAVSNHYGTLAGGHYTAFAKNYNDSQWYHFNDSDVSEIDPEQVTSKAAYLLFYRRREPNKVNSSNLTNRSLNSQLHTHHSQSQMEYSSQQ